MRVLAGLMLLALLALSAAPANAETEDDKSEAVAKAVVQAFLGFPLITLPLDVSFLESLADEDLPAPDMTGGCDPVLSKGKAGGACGPGDDFEQPGGDGGGGSGGSGGSSD